MAVRHRWALLAPAVLVLLACAPGFWGDDPDNPQPITIHSTWQCPTPSPEPTVLLGTATPADPAATPDPATTAEPIYTTPLPTATPYVRVGSDYFLNQRVGINDIHLQVTAATTQPGPTPELAYHLVTVEIEHQRPEGLPLMLDLGTLRSIRTPAGRMVQGTWYHDPAAAAALGISPAADPEVTEDANGSPEGGYPAGVSTRTLVFVAPAGQAQAWGMSFVDGGTTTRTDGTGDGQVWFLLRSDHGCTQGPGGGAPGGAELPPAGTPSVGSGGWPVPLDTPITRGYGCHPFFTGTRGPCSSGLWWHDGIDFAHVPGTPLYATRPMTVQFAGADTSPLDCSWIAGSQPPYRGFGNYVRTQDAAGYVYWYAHLQSWQVAVGQQVAAGQQLASMGSTGCSTGSHVHFRVRLGGLDRNPLEVIRR